MIDRYGEVVGEQYLVPRVAARIIAHGVIQTVRTSARG
jgi:hypothetical protein